MEDGNDGLVLIESHINFPNYPQRVHRVWGKDEKEHIACRQLFDDFIPPSLASMQSSHHIVKDGIIIGQHATKVLGQFGAEVVVKMAVTDKDAMSRRSHSSLPHEVVLVKY